MAKKPQRDGVFVSVGEGPGGWYLLFEYTDGTPPNREGPFASREDAMVVANDFAKRCLEDNATARKYTPVDLGKSNSKLLN